MYWMHMHTVTCNIMYMYIDHFSVFGVPYLDHNSDMFPNSMEPDSSDDIVRAQDNVVQIEGSVEVVETGDVVFGIFT